MDTQIIFHLCRDLGGTEICRNTMMHFGQEDVQCLAAAMGTTDFDIRPASESGEYVIAHIYAPKDAPSIVGFYDDVDDRQLHPIDIMGYKFWLTAREISRIARAFRLLHFRPQS